MYTLMKCIASAGSKQSAVGMLTSTKALRVSEAAGLLSGAAANNTRWPYLALREGKNPERMLLGLMSSSTCRSLRPESYSNGDFVSCVT